MVVGTNAGASGSVAIVGGGLVSEERQWFLHNLRENFFLSGWHSVRLFLCQTWNQGSSVRTAIRSVSILDSLTSRDQNQHTHSLFHADIRKQKVVIGRSINMALSRRGRDALAYINCEDVIVQNGIPMHARMLHDTDCHTHPVPYGTAPEHVRQPEASLAKDLHWFDDLA
jgi:hypothetical protein